MWMPLGDRYRIILSPEAQDDLKEIRNYIAWKSSRRKANNYIRKIRDFYMELSVAPHRGEDRFHQRPGMRSIGFKRRVDVLFSVSDKELSVTILGFRYAGHSPEDGSNDFA
jgi:plasmid stabilization system protein ParE